MTPGLAILAWTTISETGRAGGIPSNQFFPGSLRAWSLISTLLFVVLATQSLLARARPEQLRKSAVNQLGVAYSLGRSHSDFPSSLYAGRGYINSPAQETMLWGSHRPPDSFGYRLFLGMSGREDAATPAEETAHAIAGRFSVFPGWQIYSDFGEMDLYWGSVGRATFSRPGDRSRLGPGDGLSQVSRTGLYIDTTQSFVYPSLTANFFPRLPVGFGLSFLDPATDLATGWLQLRVRVRPVPWTVLVFGAQFFQPENFQADGPGLWPAGSALFTQALFRLETQSFLVRLGFTAQTPDMKKSILIPITDRFFGRLGYVLTWRPGSSSP